MKTLVLMPTDPEMESELRALGGHIESSKFCVTKVFKCPPSKNIAELEREVASGINGATVCLVSLVGESADTGLRALQVLQTPVILLADAEGFCRSKELARNFVCAEIILTILAGSPTGTPGTALRPSDLRVGNPLPWIPVLHGAVADHIVAAIRKLPIGAR